MEEIFANPNPHMSHVLKCLTLRAFLAFSQRGCKLCNLRVWIGLREKKFAVGILRGRNLAKKRVKNSKFRVRNFHIGKFHEFFSLFISL